MTRGEMKRKLRRDLRLGPGVWLHGDESSLDDYAREAADKVASATDCLYGIRITGLVANQRVYTMPEFYRLKTAYILDSAGLWLPLAITSVPRIQGETDAQWLNAEPIDPPRAAVISASFLRLAPAPSVTRAGALAFEGYHRPGQYWTYDGAGNGVPIADNHECPLPSWAHDCVYYFMRWQATVGDERPEVRSRTAEYQAMYREELGEVEAKAATLIDRAVQHYGLSGPWC